MTPRPFMRALALIATMIVAANPAQAPSAAPVFKAKGLDLH